MTRQKWDIDPLGEQGDELRPYFIPLSPDRLHCLLYDDVVSVERNLEAFVSAHPKLYKVRKSKNATAKVASQIEKSLDTDRYK